MLNPDGTITLYHGSPYHNLESILRKGIIPNPLSERAEERVDRMIECIERELNIRFPRWSKSFRFWRQKAIDRLLEAKNNGNIVYVSARKEYAIINSLASKEWILMLLDLAFCYKYKEYFERIRQYAKQRNRLQTTISRYFIKSQEAMRKGDLRAFQRYSEIENRLERELYRLERQEMEDEFLKKAREEMKAIKRRFRGTKAVIFEIRMPFQTFYRLLADEYSHKMLNLYFQMLEEEKDEKYKEELLPNELHLKEVKPEFIVAYEVYERDGDFPEFNATLLERIELKK